jgi:hypothetical protein
MKGMLSVLLSILLTVICWGIYGPVLHSGQKEMGGSKWLPFICVGLAYFLIAVVVPTAYLKLKGEVGQWSTTGTLWSLAAGAAGAIGALGIILALTYGGNPIYVMPLVFGGAPVVNTFLTMFMARSYKEAGPVFFAGLILVVAGAATVLLFKPAPAVQAAAGATTAAVKAVDFVLVSFSVFATALAWGVYGPVLHKGQYAMGNSKLRPLICVGVSYFLIAVLVPLAVVSYRPEPTAVWTVSGTIWSLMAGTAGALGALGIIMAFNFGGKPIFVMPLVFGGAPVVNTFYTLAATGTAETPSPLFFAGLILVAVGAVTVLIFSPKPGKKPAEPAAPTPPPASVTEQATA